MTQASADPQRASRRIVAAALALVALLTAAGVALWARFGALIFFDALASLQGCF